MESAGQWMKQYLADLKSVGSQVYTQRPGLFVWLLVLFSTCFFAPIVTITQDLALGIAQFINAAAIAMTNGPLFVWKRGLWKLMSITHLPTLIGLVVYTFLRLTLELGSDQPQILSDNFLFYFTVCYVLPVWIICGVLDIKESIVYFLGGTEMDFLADSKKQTASSSQV